MSGIPLKSTASNSTWTQDHPMLVDGAQAASFVGPAGVGGHVQRGEPGVHRRGLRGGQHPRAHRGHRLLREVLGGALVVDDERWVGILSSSRDERRHRPIQDLNII